jgi:dTMP kinase
MVVTKALASKLRGRFVVLDGVDGAGKSTHQRRLAAELTAAGVDVVSCRDPGGTAIGDRIRSVLLDHDLSGMDATCEATLFMASRAQLAAEVIRPALAAGKFVLCDRFVSATCAYQGAAGFDPRQVIELARVVLGDLWPDVTILLDVSVESGLARNHQRPVDSMEARPLEFHRRVRAIFQELPRYYPKPIVTVDASADADAVYRQIVEGLERATF